MNRFETIQIDPGAIIVFKDPRSGETFGIALATVLQCVCVSEALHVVPPFDDNWRRTVVHDAIMDSAMQIAAQAEAHDVATRSEPAGRTD